MSVTKIEWTDITWNPITGCSPISDGCKHCYAIRMANRLKAMGIKRYRNGFKVTMHPDLLDEPFKWKKQRLVFVNSMGDLFHEDIPLDFIVKVFETMTQANHHIFQILTKRSTRMAEIAPSLPWTDNIWLGVTIESDKYTYRLDNLIKTKAVTKFISLEPMLSPVNNLSIDEVDWVIVGGESGPQARAIEKDWALAVRDLCNANGTPFFFKQWGGRNKKKAGRMLEGRTWEEFPDSISRLSSNLYAST